MRKTTKILLGILFLVTGVAYYEWTVGFAHIARLSDGGKVPAEDLSASITPQKLLDNYRAKYHLPPDARIVKALAIVSSFPEKSDEYIQPQYVNDSWVIKLSTGEVLLPELPSLDQALHVLRQQARTTLARIEVVPTDATQGYVGFDTELLIGELSQLNDQAKIGLTSGILQRAASTSCRLAYSTPDDTHIADILAARCLAMTVLAEEASSVELAEPMSMAASLFDFTDKALMSASSLSVNDPWRAYLEANDSVLQSNASDAYSSYLLLRRYAELRMGDSWRAQLQMAQGQSTPYGLMTSWKLSEHGTTLQIMQVMPALLWKRVTGNELKISEAGDDSSVNVQDSALNSSDRMSGIESNGAGSDMIAKLDDVITKTGMSFSGPFFAEEDYQAVYRAYLYTSIYREAYTALMLRGSKEEAEKVYAKISASKTPEAVQFSKWYKHLIESRFGTPNKAALRQDIKETKSFGSPLVYETADVLNRLYGLASDERSDLLGKYLARSDSRLTDRQSLAFHANQLLTPGVSKRLYGSLVDQASMRYPEISAWHYDSKGDAEKVRNIAMDKRLDLSRRVKIYEHISDGTTYDAQQADLLDDVAKESPFNWGARNLLVTYLMNCGKYKEAGEVVSAWLKLVEGKDDLDSFFYWQAIITLSDIELKLGNTEQAWDVLAPNIDSSYGPMYSQAIKVALASDDKETALNLVRAALSRYPGNVPLMSDAAEVAWSGGYYDDAAMLLRNWSGTEHWDYWRKYFAKSFSRAMSNKPHEAINAVEHMISAGNNPWLIQTFAEAVSVDGNYQLAHEIQKKLIGSGPTKLPSTISAYTYLYKSGDVVGATKWLKSNLRGMPHDFIAMGAVDRYRFEVLWNVTEPSNAVYPTTIWLYRAAGYVMGKESTAEHLKELTEYYQSVSDEDRYNLFGKYLMGMVDEKRIRDLPLNVRGLSEALYYLGLGAARDKRYDDMVDWMRVCLDTGDDKNGEYRFAATLLTRWREAGGVDALVTNGELF